MEAFCFGSLLLLSCSHPLLYALLRGGKVMGFRVALSCCESALQVFGVALEQDLTASVLSCFSLILLSELSWWQVESCLLSTANYFLFWLSSALLGQ